MNSKKRLIIGTRQSKLAVWQAEYIASALRRFHPEIEVVLQFFVTQGDRVLDKPLPEIGGKGLFTAELEQALHDGIIDLAVHSFKDLPTEIDTAFAIGAVPERASPFDALISRGKIPLVQLPQGATIGTSSLRRSAQLNAFRPDLNTIPLRGNVPTRINKALAEDGHYDAIVLAVAGLDRLGLVESITEILDSGLMLPAPAQGALAVQCRADDPDVLELLAPLDHAPTRYTVAAERSFLNALDSGCRLPVAALGQLDDTKLTLVGRVANLDGSETITVHGELAQMNNEQNDQQAVLLGRQLAAQAIEQGADKLLDAVRRNMTV